MSIPDIVPKGIIYIFYILNIIVLFFNKEFLQLINPKICHILDIVTCGKNRLKHRLRWNQIQYLLDRV